MAKQEYTRPLGWIDARFRWRDLERALARTTPSSISGTISGPALLVWSSRSERHLSHHELQADASLAFAPSSTS
jgi:hypothetical protein